MSVLPSPKPPHSPSVGNELMPSANYDFKFKDYAPWVFCELHEDYFHLDPTDYLLSLGFHTGMVWVGKVQTIPVPVNTTPAMGMGTHRTCFIAVFLNTHSANCTHSFYLKFISMLLDTCIIDYCHLQSTWHQ